MANLSGVKRLCNVVVFLFICVGFAVAQTLPNDNDILNLATHDVLDLINSDQSELHFEIANTAAAKPENVKTIVQVNPLRPVTDGASDPEDTVTLFYRPLGIIEKKQTIISGLTTAPRRIVLLSPSAHDAVQALFPATEILLSGSAADAIRQLRSGAVDGIIANALTIRLLLAGASEPLLKYRMIPALKVNYGFTVLNASPALMSQINEQIAHYSPSLFRSLVDRQELMGVISSKDRDYIYLWKYIIGTLLITLVISLLVIFQLFHSRRLIAKKLGDATMFWETLIKAIPTPIVVCSVDGIITHCNMAFLDSLGLTHQAVLSQPVNLLSKEYQFTPPLTSPALVSALLSDTPNFFEGSILINNKKIDLLQWVSKYHGADGVPRGIVLGWTDISNRKHLEEKLAVALTEATRASEEKSRFLARMSHEIRSPLNVIMGVLDMEMQKLTPDNSMLPVANSAAIHLMDIVGQVLDLSKIEAGEMRLNIQPVALAERLSETCINYRFMAERKGLVFKADFEVLRGINYLCDMTKVIQTISNLISNAIKYTDSGYVNVLAELEGGENGMDNIAIVVNDTGKGIPSEKLAEMLKPYTQAEDPLPGSTGLGLNIVQQFVNLMGGHLYMESTLGKGSVFRVHLPLQPCLPPYAELATNDSDPSDPVINTRILLVDDSPSGLMIIAMQLRALGYDVITATDGSIALKTLANQSSVDFIITDCNMPVLDGYAFAREVRMTEEGLSKHHLILGVTANAFSDEEAKCLASGMDGVLIKPFRADALKRTLHSLRQSLSVDMTEVDILTMGAPELRVKFLNEMLDGASNDLNSIVDTAGRSLSHGTAELKDIVHRLKGVYAFASFIRGEEICEEIEWMLRHKTYDVSSAILRLKQANYHFAKLIQNELQTH